MQSNEEHPLSSLLLAAHILLNDAIEAALAERSLDRDQLALLNLIRKSKLRQGELLEQFAGTTDDVARVLRSLQLKGLVTRASAKQKPEEVDLRLTVNGDALVRRANHEVARIEEKAEIWLGNQHGLLCQALERLVSIPALRTEAGAGLRPPAPVTR